MSSAQVDNRLSAIQNSFLNFFTIANSGDVNSAYRGRCLWTKYEVDDLVKPAEALLTEVPAARGAVLHYITLLLHENVHLSFLERERKEGAVKGIDYSRLETAVRALIAKLDSLRLQHGQKSSAFPLQLLNWLFELFSEVCRQNYNRPFFGHQRPVPSVLLNAFQQIPAISDLLALLEATFTSILNVATDKAIHAFITAHKNFFANFDWITAHITDSFPPDLVNSLVTTGANEFQSFCTELNQANAKRIGQLQEDYAARLRLFSDIFQYMERNRKLELRICFLQIFSRFMEIGDNLPELVFLLKLALVTPEIVLPLTDELIQLAINPRLHERLSALNLNPSFRIAVSYPIQLQNFTTKLLERASTNSLFRLSEFMAPIMFSM